MGSTFVNRKFAIWYLAPAFNDANINDHKNFNRCNKLNNSWTNLLLNLITLRMKEEVKIIGGTEVLAFYLPIVGPVSFLGNS